MPARKIRKSKTRIGYRIPPDIERFMAQLTESGEFTTKAEIISAALRFWHEYRRFDVRSAVTEFLLSDEGQKLIRFQKRK